MNTKIVATAIGSTLLFTCTMRSAGADTWVFRDISRPHGHERALRTKFADAHKCGAVRHAFSEAVVPNMQQCMLAHGWALDHVVPDASPRTSHLPGLARVNRGRSYEEDLEKRNEDAANDAERQRDEAARSDDFQRQIQDQNATAAANALAKGQ
jgi:hypothetical protein